MNFLNKYLYVIAFMILFFTNNILLAQVEENDDPGFPTEDPGAAPIDHYTFIFILITVLLVYKFYKRKLLLK